MSNFFLIICLKCQNLKEITRDGKYVKFVEYPKAYCFRVGRSLLENKYPIIDNIFVSYINLVKHNMSPQFIYLKKIEIIVKSGLIMVKMNRVLKHAKEVPSIFYQNFQNYVSFTNEMDFEIK
jgi:hypothetical protein